MADPPSKPSFPLPGGETRGYRESPGRATDAEIPPALRDGGAPPQTIVSRAHDDAPSRPELLTPEAERARDDLRRTQEHDDRVRRWVGGIVIAAILVIVSLLLGSLMRTRRSRR